jgi:hypothetical protein
MQKQKFSKQRISLTFSIWQIPLKLLFQKIKKPDYFSKLNEFD